MVGIWSRCSGRRRSYQNIRRCPFWRMLSGGMGISSVTISFIGISSPLIFSCAMAGPKLLILGLLCSKSTKIFDVVMYLPRIRQWARHNTCRWSRCRKVTFHISLIYSLLAWCFMRYCMGRCRGRQPPSKSSSTNSSLYSTKLVIWYRIKVKRFLRLLCKRTSRNE